MDWKDITKELPDPDSLNRSYLMYSPSMANDKDFPGHPYTISNPEYIANGNAEKHGYTHWAEITGPID